MNDEPAFPTHATLNNCYNGAPGVGVVGGLTKREYFAAMAMPHMLDGVFNVHGATTESMIERAAELSVRGADALIAALEKK